MIKQLLHLEIDYVYNDETLEGEWTLKCGDEVLNGNDPAKLLNELKIKILNSSIKGEIY